MNIDDQFVAAIETLGKTETIYREGMGPVFTKLVYNPPLPEEPTATALVIATLGGLVAFCSHESQADRLIHVASPQSVNILSPIFGVKKQREYFLSAQLQGDKFPFGKFMSHPEFMVAIQAQFMDFGDRADVMKTIGNIVENNEKTSRDDGVSQQVIARSGVALVGELQVPNPVMLRPYRTFREVEQPPSKFVLRVQAGRNGTLPEVALFEADGGQWKLEAIASIREYLHSALPAEKIIA